VRAYDPQTGALLWHDEFDLARDNDRIHAVVAEPGRVIAGGFGTDSTGKERLFIRAFDARTGNILWEIK
jgi:outer membrane protein assembly factor BamB